MAFWPVLWVLLPPRCVSCCVWGSGWLMAAVVRQSPGWLDGKRSFLCVALPWSSRMEEGRQAASHAEPRGGFSGGSSWGGVSIFDPLWQLRGGTRLHWGLGPAPCVFRSVAVDSTSLDAVTWLIDVLGRELLSVYECVCPGLGGRRVGRTESGSRGDRACIGPVWP